MQRAPIAQAEPDHGARNAGCVGRTSAIGRFEPALLAADHAARDQRRARRGIEPVTAALTQGGMKIAMSDLHDAEGFAARRHHAAIERNGVGAQ